MATKIIVTDYNRYEVQTDRSCTVDLTNDEQAMNHDVVYRKRNARYLRGAIMPSGYSHKKGYFIVHRWGSENGPTGSVWVKVW